MRIGTDPDPESQTNADPDSDPGQTWKSKLLHEKYTYYLKYALGQKQERIFKAFLKLRKLGLILNFGKFPCSWIRIHNTVASESAKKKITHYLFGSGQEPLFSCFRICDSFL